MRIHGEFVSFARIRGRLYRVDPRYPGLVDGCGAVRGELWRLRNPSRSLAQLDRYEGDYPRLRRNVYVREGRRRAWVYLFTGDIDGKERIREWR